MVMVMVMAWQRHGALLASMLVFGGPIAHGATAPGRDPTPPTRDELVAELPSGGRERFTAVRPSGMR